VDIATRLTRDITLNVPIVSAAMDTVTRATSHRPRAGGRHRDHPQELRDRRQWRGGPGEALASGMIVNPITLPPTSHLSRARADGEVPHLRVPITEGKKLVAS